MWSSCEGVTDVWLFSLCAFTVIRAAYKIYVMMAYDHARVNAPGQRNKPVYVQTRIRDFWVTSEEGEQRVRAFYEWLDSPAPESNEHELARKRMKQFNLHNTVRLSSYQVRKMLTQLYHESCMWHKLDVPWHEEYEFAQLWLKQLEDAYHRHLLRFFKQFDTAKKKGIKVALVTKLMRDYIVFSKMLTHPEVRTSNCRFTRQVYRKMLEFSACSGFLPALLAFGHLQPTLVCDDCYPVLNNDTEVYRELVALEDLVHDKTFGPLVDEFEDFIIL